MSRLPLRLRQWALLRGTIALMLTATPAACSRGAVGVSKPLVTDVAHSAVKNQSIGNCWLYAAASWAESLHLAATGEEFNLSESYWTWWHFYDQLVGNPAITELETGGWWETANGLIREHGYLLEGEFIASEDGMPRSLRQKAAVAALNEALKTGGALATPASRTPELVRSQLDLAFGTNMAEAEGLARDPSAFTVGTKPDGGALSLLDATNGDASVAWTSVDYPMVYGETTVVSDVVKQSRKALLKRVMRALNDRQPVVMTLMIDFNAWDRETGVFDPGTLEAAGAPGTQGGHMLVLEDYAVSNVPGLGAIGEGDVSDEMKAAALTGDLTHFVTKNSWSESVSQGYHRFTIGYLDAQLAWKRPSADDVAQYEHYTTLSGFVLPPGY